jgi:sugar (pentulose or hexulose) kinase
MSTTTDDIRNWITQGKAILGIELGSTRMKAVLIGKDHKPICSGGCDWENSYIDNVWTYSLDDVWESLQSCYLDLSRNVLEQFGVEIETFKAIGISGMMHGYIPFDRNDKLLAPFRTWRNNITKQASELLTKELHYPIPQRWSVAYLYQSILENQDHINEISFITTLAGYVHYKLTGKKVVGLGEASGMFPMDIKNGDYNNKMISQFNDLISDKSIPWEIQDILPKAICAGACAGQLSKAGAKLLDISGKLKPGIALCPPEGDASTGMVATNSIAIRTGNVSAGTSAFACIVLEKELDGVYHEIDQLITPDGKLVALIHSNNCSSDISAWVNIFGEAIEALGVDCSKNKLYSTLFNLSLKGDLDCGGLMSYGYISGEHLTGFTEGRPLFVRSTDSNFSLANFMKTHIYTSFAAIKLGLNILFERESVDVDEILAHGGMFKTEKVAQKAMATALNIPISVMETASEGGAWGIALLASYMIRKSDDEQLEDFLNKSVFNQQQRNTIFPKANEVEGYNAFFERHMDGIAIERAAVLNTK